MAEAAAREGQSHVGYLEALLAAEMEERESRAITRLLHEAKLPRMKTLDGFEFDRSSVSAAQLRTLAEGDYVAKAEPILLAGEAGTGKTHLATGAVRGRLSSTAAAAIHDRYGADQRVGGGRASQPTQPRARPMGTPRSDLY